MRRSVLFFVGVLLLVCSTQWRPSSGAVIGVDFGSQWYKIAMIKPGFYDIILNEQSNRKTPTMVGWHNGERFFGADALTLWSRNPSQSYSYITQVLGKPKADTMFTNLKEFFPYTLVEDGQRGSVSVQHEKASEGAEGTYLPEELVAMILRRAKEQAIRESGASVNDCVLTIPPYLTQYERQALIDAANIAGLNVLSLIHDTTAFALNFGKERTFELGNFTNAMFIDIGGSAMKVAIVEFTAIPDPKFKANQNKTITQMTVRASAWDKEIGGRLLDLKLVNHYKAHIKKQQPSINVEDIRITLKLMKEAQKMKEVLSANQQATVSIGGLSGEYDFTMTVTRTEFEDLCASVWARVAGPIQQALTDAGMEKTDMAFVELVGGVTRVPKVQTILRDIVGRGEAGELDRHLNGDEAAAMGAAFYAAGLSSSFRVKDIKLRDITPYSVSVTVTKGKETVIAPAVEEEKTEDEAEIDETAGATETHTSLFKRHNRMGSKKGMTFRTGADFTLALAYDTDSHIPEYAPRSLGVYKVSGLPTTEKYNFTGLPKIHTSFRLSTSGVVTLEKAEAEITVITYPKPAPVKTAEEATVEKLLQEADAKTDNDAEAKDQEAEAQDTQESDTEREADADAEPDAPTPEGEDNAAAKEGEEKAEDREDAPSTDKADEPAKEDKKAKKAKVETGPKKKVHRIPLNIEFDGQGIISLNAGHKKKADQKLSALDQRDKDRADLQNEKNSLEAFIYEMRDKLERDEVIKASTSDERDKINTEVNAAQDWLYEVEGQEGQEGAMISDFRSKLRGLRAQAKAIFFRLSEREDLPEAAQDLRSYIKSSRKYLSTVTTQLNVTEEERDNVSEVVDKAEKWLEEKLEAQAALESFVDPVVTSEEVERRRQEIEMRVKIISRKPKRKPVIPKVEKPAKADPSGKEATTPEAEGNPDQTVPTQEDRDTGADTNTTPPETNPDIDTPTEETKDEL